MSVVSACLAFVRHYSFLLLSFLPSVRRISYGTRQRSFLCLSGQPPLTEVVAHGKDTVSIFPQEVQAKIGWLHNLRHSCRVFFYKAGHSGVKTREMPAAQSWHSYTVFCIRLVTVVLKHARCRLHNLGTAVVFVCKGCMVTVVCRCTGKVTSARFKRRA